jgi:hypothetical protein
MIDSKDLTIDQKAVLLVFSNIPRKFKKSRTYLEKFLFLLVKAFPEMLDYFDSTFESYKYGPYNEYAEEVFDSLKDYRLIDDSYEFTSAGKKIVEEVKKERETNPLVLRVEEFSDLLKDLDIDDILYLTYNLYPDFTDKSVIRDKVRSSKLESFKVNIKELEGEKEIIVHSDKGSRIKLKKVSSRLEVTEE